MIVGDAVSKNAEFLGKIVQRDNVELLRGIWLHVDEPKPRYRIFKVDGGIAFFQVIETKSQAAHCRGQIGMLNFYCSATLGKPPRILRKNSLLINNHGN